MTLTRSQTGATPRKTSFPDFVETPGRQRKPRKSTGVNGSADGSTKAESPSSGEESRHSSPAAQEVTSNGSANGAARKSARSRKAAQQDWKVDDSGEREFGGTFGVTAMMIGFPLLMWYMWAGATHYNGQLPMPAKGQSFVDFLKELGSVCYNGAFPHAQAWAIYWSFFIFEALCYLYMPGVYSHGKRLEHLGGKQLRYYCSAFTSFYLTIAVAGLLHWTGLFPLYTLVDEFGPLMSVGIFSGFLVSIAAYISALYRGAEHRMTGEHIYDFFMGAELNPRMLGWLDFKMFFEVRLPFFILFLITLGACARQYETLGYVSGELCFLLMAHYLYANACSKGEELITTTWDMYYEKWGFMLIFWNMAGVPLSYCHCSIYMALNAPSNYHWNRYFLAFLFVSYLFVYWIWDTCGSQKNFFRGEQRGTTVDRNTFPQLPWRRVKNPETIPVPNGDDLLCDGWYKYARKIHYTCDVYFAICWALVCSFNSPLPWFYPVFYVLMITHRAHRDIARCRERYGKAWEEYERRCPYLFIPYVY